MMHDQLRQLLLEHDCVTLPGFGALLAEPVPARIHPVRHTLSPPARRVAFSDRLLHDDGLLTAAVRRALPADESGLAPARVRSFATELRAALRQHRTAELRGLGTLRQLTDADPIRFEALEPGYLPLAASFGLPELVSRPVVLAERTRATRYVPEATSTNSQLRSTAPVRLRRLAGEGAEPLYRLATVFVLVLGLSATYLNFRLTPLAARFLPGALLVKQESPVPQRAAVGTATAETANSTAPVGSVADNVVVADSPAVITSEKAGATGAMPASVHVVPKPEPPVGSVATSAMTPVAVAEVATKAAPVRTAPTNRYYLVWNAFTTQVKAEKGRAQLLKLTPAEATNVPTVLKPPRGSVLFRVAVADFATQAEALAAKPALQARYGPALWTLRY